MGKKKSSKEFNMQWVPKDPPVQDDQWRARSAEETDRRYFRQVSDEELYSKANRKRLREEHGLDENAPPEAELQLVARDSRVGLTNPAFARKRWQFFTCGRPCVVPRIFENLHSGFVSLPPDTPNITLA